MNWKMKAAIAAGVALVLYGQYRQAKHLVTTKLNPGSDQNVVYQAVKGDRLDSLADRIFGAIDLVNPFNKSDAYARQVYGLDSADQTDDNINKALRNAEGIGE